MKRVDIIRNLIEVQLKLSEVKIDYMHSELTLKWALKLKSDADISLQIAAIGHDYERSFPDRERSKDYNTYDQYKNSHALKSAKMIVELMDANYFSVEEIEKTKKLIENHEIGGKGDLQVLTDADSLAFFEWNIPDYIETHSIEETKKKIIFMYKRISKNAKWFLNQITFEDNVLEKLYKETIKNIYKND